MLSFLGRAIIKRLERLVSYATLTVLAAEALALRRAEGRRVVRTQVARQIVFTGWDAIPIVSFLAALFGVAFILTLVTLFPELSSRQLVGKALSFTLVRELGPITTTVVVILRSCSAVTTELGYMSAQGEVEALETLGVDPAKFLLMPRFVGITSAVLGLTVLFIIVAFAAGFTASLSLGDAPTAGYLIDTVTESVTVADVLIGLFKALLFGIMIAAVSCYHGLSVQLITQIPPRVTQALVGALTNCTVAGVVITVITV